MNNHSSSSSSSRNSVFDRVAHVRATPEARSRRAGVGVGGERVGAAAEGIAATSAMPPPPPVCVGTRIATFLSLLILRSLIVSTPTSTQPTHTRCPTENSERSDVGALKFGENGLVGVRRAHHVPLGPLYPLYTLCHEDTFSNNIRRLYVSEHFFNNTTLFDLCVLFILL